MLAQGAVKHRLPTDPEMIIDLIDLIRNVHALRGEGGGFTHSCQTRTITSGVGNQHNRRHRLKPRATPRRAHTNTHGIHRTIHCNTNSDATLTLYTHARAHYTHEPPGALISLRVGPEEKRVGAVGAVAEIVDGGTVRVAKVAAETHAILIRTGTLLPIACMQ